MLPRVLQAHGAPGAINASTVREMRAAITGALEMNDAEFAAWVGRHLSTPPGDYTLGPEEEWTEAAARERLEVRHYGLRRAKTCARGHCAWHRGSARAQLLLISTCSPAPKSEVGTG